ncbi:unnamed protein product, partial [Brachionus calyciflorus]
MSLFNILDFEKYLADIIVILAKEKEEDEEESENDKANELDEETNIAEKSIR